MIQDYIGFVVMFVVAAALGLILPILHQILGPRRPTQKKLMPYESGMDPIGSARDRFSVKFYLIAMFFIVFDIELIFMYPWAVQFRQMTEAYGAFPFIEMLVFVLILFVGYIYLYKKKGFEWE
ncbi:MAG: NADH-quinone oxidoreductase subunit A [Bacteroidetes bacterium]|nr:NADH-quinone oxidoreductase subunit A [Bacteroidota bacterium]